MNKPPATLDGAEVLCWVASQREVFYQLAGSDPPTAVAGMVVARYADGGQIYLFKCDADWQVVQDWDCGTVTEAIEIATQYAGDESLVWARTEAWPE